MLALLQFVRSEHLLENTARASFEPSQTTAMKIFCEAVNYFYKKLFRRCSTGSKVLNKPMLRYMRVSFRFCDIFVFMSSVGMKNIVNVSV